MAKANNVIVENDDIKYPCCPFYTTLLPKRYFAISTRHGPHTCLEEGDEIPIYNSNHSPFPVKVVFWDEEKDFVVFESKVKLCDHMPVVGPVVGGTPYVMLVCFESKIWL